MAEERINKRPALRVIVGGRTAAVMVREFAAALDTALSPPRDDASGKPIRYEAAALTSAGLSAARRQTIR